MQLLQLGGDEFKEVIFLFSDFVGLICLLQVGLCLMFLGLQKECMRESSGMRRLIRHDDRMPRWSNVITWLNKNIRTFTTSKLWQNPTCLEKCRINDKTTHSRDQGWDCSVLVETIWKDCLYPEIRVVFNYSNLQRTLARLVPSGSQWILGTKRMYLKPNHLFTLRTFIHIE